MNSNQRATIFAVGGGKGGVGKSLLAIGMATVLAGAGRSVVLADLDLGMANLHTYLGIHTRTPTIADFFLGRASTLDEILVRTPVRNLGLISGAEFVPGMANPAHWTKMRLMRRLKSLPVDYVVLDLGAGAHFNTLDFFGLSDRGVVITAPEPGAVMNAYGFIKGALFRRIQGVFKNHPVVAQAIEAEIKTEAEENKFSLEWFTERVSERAPDLVPLIGEIEQSFLPALVINRAPMGKTHLLVKNLIALSRERLGIRLEHVGDIPDTREISNHLLNVPRFLGMRDGEPYYTAVRAIVDRLVGPGGPVAPMQPAPFDMADEDRDEIVCFIDTLDDSVFTGAGKNTWKLRMFFRPADVIAYLVSRGVTHQLFSKYR